VGIFIFVQGNCGESGVQGSRGVPSLTCRESHGSGVEATGKKEPLGRLLLDRCKEKIPKFVGWVLLQDRNAHICRFPVIGVVRLVVDQDSPWWYCGDAIEHSTGSWDEAIAEVIPDTYRIGSGRGLPGEIPKSSRILQFAFDFPKE